MAKIQGSDHVVVLGPIFTGKTKITLEQATVSAKRDLQIPGPDRKDVWQEWQIIYEKKGGRRILHTVHATREDGERAFAEHLHLADEHDRHMRENYGAVGTPGGRYGKGQA